MQVWNVFFVTYVLVDEEMSESWGWFLRNLAQHIVQDQDDVCLISDRHTNNHIILNLYILIILIIILVIL